VAMYALRMENKIPSSKSQGYYRDRTFDVVPNVRDRIGIVFVHKCTQYCLS